MSSHPSIPASRPSGIRLKDSAAASKDGEVLIIGAGPGGLANAMLLANAGLKVRIIERMNRVGGRTSAIEADGFRFDVGPTFFLYPAILRGIFNACGRNLDDYVELIKVDPNYRIHFGQNGGDILCRPDVDAMEKAIAALAPEDAKNVRAFMEDSREKLDAMKPIMQNAADSWTDWLKLVKLLKVLRPWNSLDADLKRYFKDERIRRTFSFQSKYLGMSPFNCPSMFTILSFMEYDTGVYHPKGGCAAVTEAMAKVCQEMGVTISLGEEVKEILFEGKKAVGVRTQKGEYRSEALVINADFAHTMEKLVPNHLRKKWSNEKLAKKKYSCSTFMLYLGIEGTYDDVAHHTIYLPDDYNRNIREIEETHELSEYPSFYVQNASVTDPTLAPKGMSTLYVLVPTTNSHPNVDWNKEKGRYRAHILKELEKIGLKNVESRIRYEKVVAAPDWTSQFHIYKGATFNLAHNLGQLLNMRPKNRFDELESVYLVGGGTHPGSGLPVIFESSRISAKALLKDMGMDTKFIDDTEERPGVLPAAAPVRALPARKVA